VVIFKKAILSGRLKVRCSVVDFMLMLLITKLFCISAVADGIIIIEDFLSANDKGKKKVKS
jgi:hypothetical protein